jgi:hypothetical protein
VCHARLLDDPSTQPFTVSQYFVGDRLTICMTRLKRNRSASGGWPEVHRFARLDSVLHPSTMPITLVIRSTICAGCLALGSVLGAQQPPRSRSSSRPEFQALIYPAWLDTLTVTKRSPPGPIDSWSG